MGGIPEDENIIEWMMHDNRVHETTLIHALASEYYVGLHAFASALVEEPGLTSLHPIHQAIAKAVSERHRFWNEVSLRAWLYHLTFQFCEKDKPSIFFSVKFLFGSHNELSRGGNPDHKKPTEINIKDQLPVLLAYGHEFSVEEIAYILGITIPKVKSRLNQARLQMYGNAISGDKYSEIHSHYLEMLHNLSSTSIASDDQLEFDRHINSCSGCQAYKALLPAMEQTWKEEFKPHPHQPNQAELATDEINSIVVGRTNGWNFFILPLKEVSLLVVVFLMLVYLGRAQGVFDTYDARPTYTLFPTYTAVPTRTLVPTRTPAPLPIELNGIEGDDYFYFDIWTVKGDTWETLANKAGLRVEMVRYLNPSLPDELTSSTRIRLAGLKSSDLFKPAPLLSIATLDSLTMNSTPKEVLERAQLTTSTWNSLWMNQLFISYGPPGYIGPPLSAYRVEVYARHPHQWISLRKNLDSGFSYLTYGASNWLFGSNTGSGLHTASWAPGGFSSSSSPINISWLSMDVNYQVAGEQEISSRKAVILDAYDSNNHKLQRLWIDAQTGVLLKTEVYGGPDDETIVFSMIVQAILYDISFPEDLHLARPFYNT
jgi:hypothetical protein